MSMRLERVFSYPILEHRSDNHWEAAAVFNCAAVFHNKKFHLVYRATDIDASGKDGPFVSSLGHASSSDGFHFERSETPLLTGEGEQELRGLEDPRIVNIDDTFYMMYTGYRGKTPGDYRICLASSQDLLTWSRRGIVLDEPNKDAALFPEKINGRFCMFHRRDPDIWIAFSADLSKWTDHTRVMSPVPSIEWQEKKIGIAGPPMKTKDGWLLIYHGVSHNNVYTLGIALLDLADPSKVLYRQGEPILEPELQWEKEGCVPNVVFSCGQIETDDRILVYYAGADTVIGVAKLDKKDIASSFSSLYPATRAELSK
jgi:beta-1,2-mannobiose phosphorylase / 1,2-beta-oligomannan phosphorylase